MIDGYKNYEWFLKEDFSKYAGEWIAVIEKKIVAHGKDINKIIKEAKDKYPNKKPFITKIKEKLSIL